MAGGFIFAAIWLLLGTALGLFMARVIRAADALNDPWDETPNGDVIHLPTGASSLRRKLPAGDGAPADTGGRPFDPFHEVRDA